jgi:acetoacetyl-CoA reductase
MKAGRVALVTGGTGGIGTAICQALHRAGAKVAAGYNGGGSNGLAQAWQEEQRTLGYDVLACYGDVSNFESAGALIAEVEEKLGPIDILINCAGITKDGTLKKMPLSQWELVMRINLDSVFNVSRQVIEGMLDRKFGRIINISSINGQKGQFGQTNYSSAKAGMHGFTMALAQEVANKGITVNTISPGYVNTAMVKKIAPEVLEKIVAQVPIGRLVEPTEVARLIAFLADDEAAAITGANFAINGGQYMS